jgi:hypothetical protein
MRYTISKIRKILSLALVMTLSMTGCDTEELHNLNINPQAVPEIDLNYLFTAAELGIASSGSSGDNRFIDWRTNIGMAAYAIQHLANAGGGIAPGDKYIENFETNNAPFFFLYGDPLKNVAEILRQTGPGGFDEGNKPNLQNAARILRAFCYHRLTDYYGNIPYFEANQGMDGVFFPAYDRQSAIYADLLRELGEASAALNAELPDEGFARADVIFDGDIEKWRRWGYSLMLRLAMRVSNVDAAMANEYVSRAVAGGVFQSNADNVWVPMDEGPSMWINQNGISRAFFPGDGGQPSFLSQTLVDFLKGADLTDPADDDPRLMIISGGIGEWTATSWNPINTNPVEQKGMPNGFDAGGLDALEGRPVIQSQEYSRINPLLLQRDSPYQIMNYAEVAFLLAEALERGIGSGIPGTPQEHYAAGVRAAMQMYTEFAPSLAVSDAQVDAYLAQYPYGSRPALEMIGEQMWVSKFFNWWEAWADWRRTGYPQLTPTNHPLNITGGTIPRRLRYPAQEAAANENFAIGATLPDTYTNRVWWDGGAE